MSNFTPAWFKKGFFNESLFCDDFLSIPTLDKGEECHGTYDRFV